MSGGGAQGARRCVDRRVAVTDKLVALRRVSRHGVMRVGSGWGEEATAPKGPWPHAAAVTLALQAVTGCCQIVLCRGERSLYVWLGSKDTQCTFDHMPCWHQQPSCQVPLPPPPAAAAAAPRGRSGQFSRQAGGCPCFSASTASATTRAMLRSASGDYSDEQICKGRACPWQGLQATGGRRQGGRAGFCGRTSKAPLALTADLRHSSDVGRQVHAAATRHATAMR